MSPFSLGTLVSTGNPLLALSNATYDFAVDMVDFYKNIFTESKSSYAENANMHNMGGLIGPKRIDYQTAPEASTAISALAWQMYDKGDRAIWHLINDKPHRMQSYQDYTKSTESTILHVLNDISPVNWLTSLFNVVSFGIAPEATIQRLYGPRPKNDTLEKETPKNQKPQAAILKEPGSLGDNNLEAQNDSYDPFSLQPLSSGPNGYNPLEDSSSDFGVFDIGSYGAE